MKLIFTIGHLKRKTTIIILLHVMFVFLFYAQNIHAQNRDQSISFIINGRITDSLTGETLKGVNIYLKDAKYGTVSDNKGNFSLEAPEGNYTLVFSYIGYNQKEVPLKLNRNLNLNITLSPSETPIEEVTVTAQRKFFGNMDYGREIPTISTEVIEKQNVNNASDILHARLAGVWATKTSGAPGDHEKIRIRGQSSFFSSAEPLYVVDGVPVPIVNMSSLGIADLNIHDIDNVTVLKDASATSLYGFQGGNGVVLIDTKKGHGKPKFTFITRQGIQWQSKYCDLMNTSDFLTSLDSARSKMGTPIRSRYPDKSPDLCSDDWQQELFSPGSSQEYQLSSSGSIPSLNYYLSGNYTDQEGILPQAQYSRQTLSARVSRSFYKKLVFDMGYRGSWQTNENNQSEYKGNRLLFEGISKAPCIRCTPDSLLYDTHGELLYRTYFPSYKKLSDPELPQSIVDNNQHKLKINSQILNLAARYQINDRLHMDLMESFMNRASLYTADFIADNYSSAGYYLNSEQISLESDENVILFNHQINISYNNSFGKNELGVLLANRYYKDNLWWKVDSLQGTIPEHYSLKNSMAAYGLKGSVLRNMSSYLLHLSYNFNTIYFVSSIVNLSHIKEGLYTDYFSIFPSIAFSWDLSKQFNFIKSGSVDAIELYINWGQSGNYPLNGLANDLYEDVPYSLGNSTGYFPTVLQLANHDLRHEKTTEMDVGLKSRFFRERMLFFAVYYDKKIGDMILLREIPYYYGGGKQYLNFGKISVKGYDLGMEMVPFQTSVFRWEFILNYSRSEQIVEKLFQDEDLIFNDPDILIPEFTIAEGGKLGNIYGYKYLGKMLPEDWEGHHSEFVIVQREKFLNADSSDNVLNACDKIVLGNSIPDFTANLISNITYRNFNIDFTWYMVGGASKYNATRVATYMKGVNREINNYIADTLRSIGTNYFYESDIFVEDASFIRLKTLTLSYSFKDLFEKKLNLLLSISFNNLLTFTRYSGYDPEATIFTDNNFSDNAIDRGAYPNPKSFFISLKIDF